MNTNEVIEGINIKHENETILKWLPRNGNIVKNNDYNLIVSRRMITLMITSLQMHHYGNYQASIHLRLHKDNKSYQSTKRLYLTLRTGNLFTFTDS